MSDPFLGEIKMWTMAWAPQGWLLCNGASLATQQNAALYSLLGTQFGGNTQNFLLPDLRGRTPVGSGANSYGGGTPTIYQTGNSGGAETVTLNPTTVPGHTHLVTADKTVATALTVGGNFFAQTKSSNASVSAQFNIYQPTTNGAVTNPQAMAPSTVSTTGTSAPHANMQPFTVVNFCICNSGTYPARN